MDHPKPSIKKIFVIGPIPPFTGGIAHSNATLCKNLAQRNDVTAISFSMMFPKILYPGQAQKSGEAQKGTPYKQEFILNTLNSVSWIEIVAKARKEKPDWIVFQWWHTYFFPAYYFISFFARLFSGAKVLFVCQNVLPHEEGIAQALIHRPLTKLLFGTADQLVTLSSSDLKMLKEFMPHAKADFIVEGTYQSVTGTAKVTKKEAAAKLSLLGKKILLFFGAVRPYKDLGMLLDALKIACEKRNDLFLVIAGAFWEPKEMYEKQIAKLGIEKHILIKDGYIPDAEVPLLFTAADVAILSHKTSTESGIPQLAYAYGTPLIATAVGGNVDLIENNKTGFLVPAQNPQRMAETILRFFREKKHAPFRVAMRKKKKIFEWTPEKERLFFGD